MAALNYLGVVYVLDWYDVNITLVWPTCWPGMALILPWCCVSVAYGVAWYSYYYLSVALGPLYDLCVA